MSDSKLKFTSIDDYLKQFPKDTQEILEQIRMIIHKETKHLTEGISYGIPTFYLNGKYFIYFAGYKNHVSLYPVHSDEIPFEKELLKYVSGKATVQFPLNKPIPYDLIKKIVEFKFSHIK